MKTQANHTNPFVPATPTQYVPLFILLIVPLPQSLCVCLAEVDDINIGLVHGLDCPGTRIHSQGDSSIDTSNCYPIVIKNNNYTVRPTYKWVQIIYKLYNYSYFPL